MRKTLTTTVSGIAGLTNGEVSQKDLLRAAMKLFIRHMLTKYPAEGMPPSSELVKHGATNGNSGTEPQPGNFE